MSDGGIFDIFGGKDPFDPYLSEEMVFRIRNIILYSGKYPEEIMDGAELSRFSADHDDLRRVVAWNFLKRVNNRPAYRQRVSISDWEEQYEITRQAREFARLEMNNIADLMRAILILIRADQYAEWRQGMLWSADRIVGFYELVVLLNKTEQVIDGALKKLESMKLIRMNLTRDESGRVIKFWSSIEITDEGIQFLDHGGKGMTFNNIHIVNSNVGIVSVQSTLKNIDVKVGNLKQKGDTRLAEALAAITEQVANSELAESDKKDTLEQVELLSEQADKEPEDRKLAIVRGALAFLEKALLNAANLTIIWETWGHVIKAFFNIQ